MLDSFFNLKSFCKFKIRIMFLFSREDCEMKVKMPISLAIQDPLTFNNFLIAFFSFSVLLSASRRRQTNSIFCLEIYLCRSSSTLSTFSVFHIIVASGALLPAS